MDELIVENEQLAADVRQLRRELETQRETSERLTRRGSPSSDTESHERALRSRIGTPQRLCPVCSYQRRMP